MKNHHKIQKALAINFNETKLLTQSLIHRSYLNENPKCNLASNERMEFLGDAILSFIISELLYLEFPQYDEGDLTNLRSRIVRTASLAEIARKLGLGNYLIMGRGEEESGGRKKPSLLANSLEALIGAIYLDQGIEITRLFIKKEFSPLMRKLMKEPKAKDYKSTLQEKLQAKAKQAPFYKTLKIAGPPHARTFTIGVYLRNRLLARGEGVTKQKGEEQAAKVALENLKRE